MKWRLLLIVSLLAAMLLCSNAIAYADEGEDSDLTVGIGVVGDDVEVNVGVDANNVEVNMGINSGNADIYLDGRNVNEPTVIHHTTVQSGGIGWGELNGRIRKVMTPVYEWMTGKDAAVGLTMNGLAKVIIETKSQDSAIDVMSTDIAKNSEDITRNYEELDNRLETKIIRLQAEQLALQSGLYLRLKLLLGVIGALIVSNIVFAVKIRKA